MPEKCSKISIAQCSQFIKLSKQEAYKTTLKYPKNKFVFVNRPIFKTTCIIRAL